MSASTDIQTTLEGIKTQLTARIPTQITAIFADNGTVLSALSKIQIVKRIDDPIPYERPHVAIMVDGIVEKEDMLSAKYNLRMPLLVAVTLDATADDEEGVSQANYWGRVIDNALAATQQGGALNSIGVYWIDVEGAELEEANEDARNFLRVNSTALVHVRTTRAVA